MKNPFRKAGKRLGKKITDGLNPMVLPGFHGIPLVEVVSFFVRGLRQGTLSTRAMAMSFSFLLAVFPSLIFLLTLIPYIPIKNFQTDLLIFIKEFLPKSNYETIRHTVEDVLRHQRGGLLSIGFLAALLFSTNGINAMMKNFNLTVHTMETRSPVKQRMISVMLTLLLFVLVVTAVLLLVFSESGLQYLVKIQWLKKKSTLLLLQTGKWIVFIALFFTAFSLLYYFGPAGKRKFSFVSPGSVLATILSVIISIGFAYFVNNIVSYSKLYGSIGTLVIIMLWINFNSYILLICFELNASIDNAATAYHKKHYRKTVRNVLKPQALTSPT